MFEYFKTQLSYETQVSTQLCGSSKFITYYGLWTFSLVSIHLICATGKKKMKKKKNEQECRILPTLATMAKITQEQDVILLGDFNCIPPASILEKVGYPVIPDIKFPPSLARHRACVIEPSVGYVGLFHENEYTNTVKNKCFDNILIHSSLSINHYDTV